MNPTPCRVMAAATSGCPSWVNRLTLTTRTCCGSSWCCDLCRRWAEAQLREFAPLAPVLGSMCFASLLAVTRELDSHAASRNEQRRLGASSAADSGFHVSSCPFPLTRAVISLAIALCHQADLFNSHDSALLWCKHHIFLRFLYIKR